MSSADARRTTRESIGQGEPYSNFRILLLLTIPKKTQKKA
jgi:hypothetical protein